MKTATAVQKNDLQALGRLLQERLNSELAIEVPIQVKCLIQDDSLLALAQVEENLDGDRAQSILNTLQETIEALQLSFLDSVWEQTQQVRLYLRAAGERQPFAVREFALEKPTFSEESPFSGLESVLSLDDSTINAFEWQEQPHDTGESSQVRSNSVGAKSESQDEEDTDLRSSADRDIESEPQRSSNLEGVTEETVAESTSDADLASDLPPQESREDKDPDFDFISQQQTPAPRRDSRRRELQEFKLPPSVLKIGAIVATLSFLGGLYAFTRPCAIGRQCAAIQTADRLSQQSAETLKNAENERDVNEGKEKLIKAIQQLESIPFWSGHHSKATQKLQVYKDATSKIDSALKAASKARAAAQKSQDPPHPVQEWQEVELLWKEAIAFLKQVPKNNAVYPLTQKKLKTYQANLASVQTRIVQEQQSKTKLVTAKEIAQLAQARQRTAKSLENWQQVDSTWETAINSLSSIPKTTIAYEEAQQLLSTYQENTTATRRRKSQEETSAKIYYQALSIASIAKELEQKNQWTQAVATWRRASTYAQQVPPGTFYYAQSQPLSETYANSLREAQAKLQSVLIVQKANSDLDKVCVGAPKICDRTVTLQIIKVYLTPAYTNGVRRTAMAAGLNGDAKTLASLDDHLKTLQAALEAISENAGVPLEIYDFNRNLIGRYIPNRN